MRHLCRAPRLRRIQSVAHHRHNDKSSYPTLSPKRRRCYLHSASVLLASSLLPAWRRSAVVPLLRSPSPPPRLLTPPRVAHAAVVPFRRRPDAAVVPFHRCPDAAAHTLPSSPSTAGAAVFPIGHTNRAMATHKIPHAWTTKAPSR
ncbi:hypothetical protein OsJ_13821 [Oryza sativa Japonica Group]|uniref:Uncharacterized protein n=1 Tax=Oryza sativa subsp. japonica TaxID=39947 RepID=B9FDP3_ORYSJ|nr:hypothetical protein OsJ_13821 [Oryza sativa Japonica Group]